MFNNLKTDGLEQTEDRLGGGKVHDTNIYEATIKYAYGLQSDGGAKGVALGLTLPDGSEYRETFYVTNKKGENFFLNKNDTTKKVQLPGFALIEELCLVAEGRPLSDQPMEEKVLKIYNYNEKKEVPTPVPVLVELLGKKLYVAIEKQLVDKTAKNAQSGDYEPTGETREANAITKVFNHPTQLTVPEARNGVTEAEFFNEWKKKNEGKVINKAKGASENSGSAGAPQASETKTSTTKPLFG